MTLKHIPLAIAGVCVLVLVWYRVPRLTPDEAWVRTLSESRTHMTLDIRMPEPFSVEIKHQLHPPPPPPDVRGWRIYGSKPIRVEPIAVDRSRYDYLRGEYYVRCTFRREETIVFADSAGAEHEIPAWHGSGWEQARWKPVGGVSYAEGIVLYVLNAGSEEHHEFISLAINAGSRN